MSPFVLKLLDINVVVTPILKDGHLKVSYTYDNSELLNQGVTTEEIEKEINRIQEKYDC